MRQARAGLLLSSLEVHFPSVNSFWRSLIWCSWMFSVWLLLWQEGLIRQQVVYVARDGSDWNRGTATSPLRTVQAAVNRVATGGIVLIAAGDYAERVRVTRGGRPGEPTQIRAIVPGTVVIHWEGPASKVSDHSWHRAGSLWRRSVTSPVYRLRVGDQEAYRVPQGERSLLDLVNRPGAYPAFTQVGNELLLFIPEDVSPETPIRWNLPSVGPREWGEFKSANIHLAASHLRLEGLHLQCGLGSGVRIWRGKDVTITNCVLSGCQLGVDAHADGNSIEGLKLERCLYHNYPQGDWRRKWLEWGDIYTNYARSSLVRAYDRHAVVSDCVAIHGGDGLQVSSRDCLPVDMLLERNWIALGTDDALEAEGAAAGITFRRNLVWNCHEGLGLSPVLCGPVRIEQNLILHPDIEMNGASIKLVPPQRSSSETIRNIEIRQNQFLGNWLCWYAPGIECENVRIIRNQFIMFRQYDPLFPEGVSHSENLITELLPNDLDETGAVPPQVVRQMFSASAEWSILDTVPGPDWWDWKGHPATAEFWEWRLQALEDQP